MPILGTQIKEAIRALTLRAAQEPESSPSKEIADELGALLVYADIGGALALTVEGAVVHYDFESGVTSAPDGNMQTLALVRAAKRFPELRDLAPRRPDTATECSMCFGRGLILDGMYCGKCFGKGWV